MELNIIFCIDLKKIFHRMNVTKKSSTERSEQVWTGVTGISLCTLDALAAGNGQRRIAVIQPTTFP